MNSTDLLRELQESLLAGGATLVGCADLRPLPATVRHDLPVGIAIGVALAPSIVAELCGGPTKAYAAEYRRANTLLDRLGRRCAGFLQQQGSLAVARPPTVEKLDEETLATELPHKTIVTRAGLGWIGKCALLVTKQYGSAVRYTSILTDAPLPVATPVDEPLCGDCQACVEACPAAAPSGRDWRPGGARADFFDAFACCASARRAGSALGINHVICGICIAACPYTQRYIGQAGRSCEDS